MDHRQLREHVIRPVLRYLDAYSESAEELLVLTAAHESLMGEYLHQTGGGPAVGIYQMEPATHDDIWASYLAYRHALAERIAETRTGLFQASGQPALEMAGNLYYATAMARAHYLRVPETLPGSDDSLGLAGYWKSHYNTTAGAGTVAQALSHYQRYAV